MSLVEAVQAIAAKRVAETVAALALRIAAEAPDRQVMVEGDAVVVTGRGVFEDPRLQWIGSLLR
jgi:hypothetical protein